MSLITTTSELSEFCGSLAAARYITVDTEFMRERTYWPKLCLVQIGGPDGARAIDPLADGIDLAPLIELLNNPQVMKVFHAARQDVEIFYNLSGQVPLPLFDTQVAAMVCGFGDAASYENLASKLANAQIDKSSRFTDWSHRPLSERQIAYALDDVIHLRTIYEKLSQQLEKTGRATWVGEEMGVLIDPGTYRVDPMEIWRRLKLRADKPRVRAILRELAAWRELEAQRIDVPRGRILRDEALLEIAHHAPTTAADLARTRGLSNGFAEGRHGEGVLGAVQRALALPQDQYPSGSPRKDLPNWIGSTVDLLKVLLRQVSEQHDVAVKLIATTDDLERIAAEDNPDIPAMQGWRYEIFGKLAEQLKKGEIGVKIEARRIKIVHL